MFTFALLNQMPRNRSLELKRIKLQYLTLLYSFFWQDYVFNLSHKWIGFGFSVNHFLGQIVNAQLTISKETEDFAEGSGARSTWQYFGGNILRGLVDGYCVLSVFITPEVKQVSEEVKTGWCYKKLLWR